jgi:hypothetical protein
MPREDPEVVPEGPRAGSDDADKKLAQLIGASRVFAKTDPCGNTLGLMFTHARFALKVP